METEELCYSGSVSVTFTIRKLEEKGPFRGGSLYVAAIAGIFVGCFEVCAPDPWQWVGRALLDRDSREYEAVVDQINAWMRKVERG